jgi:mannose-6-phosphate isomerase-like protein (cupin superfamily)
MAEQPFDLSRFPVHLGSGASVQHLPEFDGSPGWYERYGAAHEADGADGRLVSLHTFDAPWDSWEVHPHGEELVACTSGRITLHQEIDGEVRTAVLETGGAIVNPAGVWHTADVEGTATALFITAGLGTQVRPRA